MVMKEVMVIIPMEATQVASHNLELPIGKMLNFSLDCILLKIETSSAAMHICKFYCLILVHSITF